MAVTEIKVDWDRRSLVGHWVRLTTVARWLRLPIAYVRYDRTRKGWHVRVGVTRRVAAWRVVCLQAICGSDWRRELFNLVRVGGLRHVSRFWRSRWNVLFTHAREVAA